MEEKCIFEGALFPYLGAELDMKLIRPFSLGIPVGLKSIPWYDKEGIYHASISANSN